jgi:hypothetical protein
MLVFDRVRGFSIGMKIIVLIMCLWPFIGTAQAGEKKLDAKALTHLLSDIRLASTESGRVIEQVFQASGATFTIDIETHQQSQGFWTLRGDKYCSQWPPSENWECFDVYGNDQGVVFVSSYGKRYQMELPPAD